MNDILFVGEHPRTYNVHWHMHEYWEIVYCTGGGGEFSFKNGATMPYKEWDVIALPPNEIHSNTSIGGFTNIHIQMNDPTFPTKTTFKVTDDNDGRIRSAFTQAKYYYLADIKKSDLVLVALGDLIAAYLTVYRSNNDFSEQVEYIRTEILKYYTTPEFALDEVLRRMPYNYDYLRKLFHRETGVTPNQYMMGMRMKKAESILNAMRVNEYSVAEIAFMCGFDDPLYFSRVFSKNFGCSPSRFVGEKGKALSPSRRDIP